MGPSDRALRQGARLTVVDPYVVSASRRTFVVRLKPDTTYVVRLKPDIT